MPKSFLATPGKSRLVIFLPNRLLLNDHSAREMSKRGFFLSSALASRGRARPAALAARKSRRLSCRATGRERMGTSGVDANWMRQIIGQPRITENLLISAIRGCRVARKNRASLLLSLAWDDQDGFVHHL